MAPLSISVVMPTVNRAHMIERAIDSVLSQITAPDEFIVVDDGSTDQTAEVVGRYANQIRYVKTANRGAGAARNSGVEKSTGDLIAFIDSDDEWLPNKVLIQRPFMENMPEVLFSFSNFSSGFPSKDNPRITVRVKHNNIASWTGHNEPWDELLGPGRPISDVVRLPQGQADFNYYVGSMYIPELKAHHINVNTLMVRKKQAGAALRFAEDTLTFEDKECGARLSAAGKAAYLDFDTAQQNNHPESRLTDAHATEVAEMFTKIMERVWGQDAAFLQHHAALYERLLNERRLTLVKGLLVRGDTRRAREEMAKLTVPSPLSIRGLANLPGPMTKSLLDLRRGVRRMIGRHS